MKKRKLSKKKIISFILIVFTISNFYFIAKYTSALVGYNSKSIAKWNVECNSSNQNSLNLVSGNKQESYTLNVTSTSEVSATYSVVLSNVPSELEVKIDQGNFKAPTNNTITFDNVGSFTANDINNTYNHTITFNAPLDSNIPSINNIDIDVIFNQKD